MIYMNPTMYWNVELEKRVYNSFSIFSCLVSSKYHFLQTRFVCRHCCSLLKLKSNDDGDGRRNYFMASNDFRKYAVSKLCFMSWTVFFPSENEVFYGDFYCKSLSVSLIIILHMVLWCRVDNVQTTRKVTTDISIVFLHPVFIQLTVQYHKKSHGIPFFHWPYKRRVKSIAKKSFISIHNLSYQDLYHR